MTTDAQKIVEIASAIVTGELELVAGCRRLLPYVYDKRHHDEAAHDIYVFEAQTDEMPIGTVRQTWTTEALEKIGMAHASYISEMRPRIIDACKSLIAKGAGGGSSEKEGREP